MAETIFPDRFEAGRRLADALHGYAHKPDVLVLALPRGGVPVGFEVAQALGAPLDVFVVRKLGLPWQPELAMGAIASGGVRVLNDEVVKACQVSPDLLATVTAIETEELEQREKLFRGSRPPPEIAGHTIIVVDDGLATGSTMKAAVTALQALHPKRLVVATPVSAADTAAWFQTHVDEFVCLQTPQQFMAVGLWYQDFQPTTDEEVRVLLERAAQAQPV